MNVLKHFCRTETGKFDFNEWHYFTGGFSIGGIIGFVVGCLSGALIAMWILNILLKVNGV